MTVANIIAVKHMYERCFFFFFKTVLHTSTIIRHITCSSAFTRAFCDAIDLLIDYRICTCIMWLPAEC